MFSSIKSALQSFFLKLSGKEVSDLLNTIETQQALIENLESISQIHTGHCKIKLTKCPDGNYNLNYTFYISNRISREMFLEQYAAGVILECRRVILECYKDYRRGNKGKDDNNVIPLNKK